MAKHTVVLRIETPTKGPVSFEASIVLWGSFCPRPLAANMQETLRSRGGLGGFRCSGLRVARVWGHPNPKPKS